MLAVQKTVMNLCLSIPVSIVALGLRASYPRMLMRQPVTSVLEFLGADSEQHTCIFGKNTTEAINKLARRYPFTAGKELC